MECLYFEEGKEREFILYTGLDVNPGFLLKKRNKMYRVNFLEKLTDVLNEGGFDLLKISYIPNLQATQIVTLGCDRVEVKDTEKEYAKILLKEYHGKDIKVPKQEINEKVTTYLSRYVKYNYELRFESNLTQEEREHEKELFDIILTPTPGPFQNMIGIYDITNRPFMLFGLRMNNNGKVID